MYPYPIPGQQLPIPPVPGQPVPPPPPHGVPQNPYAPNTAFVPPRPVYPMPMQAMNPMMPPFANPYRLAFLSTSLRPNQFEREQTETAMIQRAYAQKWEQIQRAKALNAASENVDQSIDKTGTENADKASDSKSSPTVVGPEGISLYVGKLSKEIADDFFTRLLNVCGVVLKWKRMKETFGFVNFEDAEGALRCLNLMNGMKLYDQTLTVKSPEKSTLLIDAYKKTLTVVPEPNPICVEVELRTRSRSRSRSRERDKKAKDKHRKRRDREREREKKEKRSKTVKNKHSLAESQSAHLLIDDVASSDNDDLRARKYEEGLKEVLVSDDRDKAAKNFLISLIMDQYKVDNKNKRNEASKARHRESSHHRRERHYHHSHPSREGRAKRDRKRSEVRAKEKSKSKYNKRKYEDKDNLSLSFALKASNSSKEVSKVFDTNQKDEEKKQGKESVMEVDKNENENDDDNAESVCSSPKPMNDNDEIEILSAQDLVALIPSTQRKLFDWDVDWDIVDEHKIIQNVMTEWLNDRFYEYLGQEELVLVDFVAELLKKRNSATKVIVQLKMVLSNDTEQFVMKMWRRLIFETLKIKHNV